MAPKLLRQVFAAVLLIQLIVPSVRADDQDVLSYAFKHVWNDQKRIVTSPLRVNKLDLLVWGTTIGSILYLAPRWGGSTSADERFDHGLNRDNESLNHFLKGFTHVGDAAVMFGVTLTSYGVAYWQEWPRMRTGSLHTFEGLMDAGISAEVISILAGRRRPVDTPSRGPFLGPWGYFSDSNNGSFVSGHAAMTFAAATVISHESGTYWVGVPAYLIAGGVSYSRIYVQRHWLSDVIGGGVLGYSIGILVEHNRHSKPQLAGTFYPTIDNKSVGVAWSRQF